MEVSIERSPSEIQAMRGDNSVSLGLCPNTQNGQNGVGCIRPNNTNDNIQSIPEGQECPSATKNVGSANEKCASNWNASTPDAGKKNFRELVESSIGSQSKCFVEKILQQVNQLSDPEKLLLYLKLPGGRSPDFDPLKQPLNVLGNRSEIPLTISWIKSNLKPNLDVSIPKQEVYTLYRNFCLNNKIKPLNTADFGKVMKQVFPDVIPRRLGHRGESRYCYSGLDRNDRLNPPFLPDFFDSSTSTVERKMVNSENLDDNEVSCIILEWAERINKRKFDTLRELAAELVRRKFDTTSMRGQMLDYRPGDTTGSHRDVNMKLQKKLQEGEQKRKLQESGNGKNSSECPKARRRNGTNSRSLSTDSSTNLKYANLKSGCHSSIPEAKETRTIYEKSVGTLSKVRNSQPAFKDSRKGSLDSNTIMSWTVKQEGTLKPSIKVEHEGSDNSKLKFNGNGIAQEDGANEPRDVNILSNANKCLRIMQKSEEPVSIYKPIQPKANPSSNLVMVSNNDNPGRSYSLSPFSSKESYNINLSNNNSFNNRNHTENLTNTVETKNIIDSNQIPFGNQSSVGQATNMSQESEKILRECLQILVPTSQDAPSMTYQETLQTDLEGNFKIESADPTSDFFGMNPLSNAPPGDKRVGQSASALAKSLGLGFSPIINHPYSNNSNQVVSQCSSTNGSPFTSPHNTPSTRSRNNSGQNSSTYLTPRSTPFTPENNPILGFPSECGTPFVSPANTPLRSRHNSTPYSSSRSRHSSGAPIYRHNPYSEENSNRRAQKFRSRHISGNLPQSAPLSPLVHEEMTPSTSSQFGADRRRHISMPANCFHHHQQPQILHQQLPPQPIQQPVTYMLPNVNNEALNQEISNALTGASTNWCTSINTTAGNNNNGNRPQSVPLLQMLDNSCTNENPIPKSYPTTPNMHQQFNFNSDSNIISTSSNEHVDFDTGHDRDSVFDTANDRDSILPRLSGGSELFESLAPNTATSDIGSAFADAYSFHETNYSTTEPPPSFSPIEENSFALNAGSSRGANASCNEPLPSNLLGGGGSCNMALDSMNSDPNLQSAFDPHSQIEEFPPTFGDLSPDFSMVLGCTKE